MKSKLMILGMVVLAGAVLMMAPVLAVAQETELDYSWGTVVEMSDDTIVLQEYDYETEGVVNVSYVLGEGVVVENAASLDEVQPGNDVEVGFITQDQQKIITTLYVEKDASVEEE